MAPPDQTPAQSAPVQPVRRTRRSIGPGPRRLNDKENTTLDLLANIGPSRKKLRSKSIGPGGLDALKQGTGNRRASLAIPPRAPPKSILKPTPSLSETTTHSRKPKSRISNAFGGLGGDPLSNVPEVSHGSKVALRTEEQQQKAAREREERERRDARRKSLANRRVSFAAEATLHTFHEVEYNQDSASSNDNTRRAPDPSANSSSSSDAGTNPTPEGPAEAGSAQPKSRRSSTGIQPMSSRTGNDDDTMASTVYGSSDSELIEDVEDVSSDRGSDAEDETIMSVEVDEMTSASVGSLLGSPGAEDISDSLDEALRLAARQAGTQRLDIDDDDDDGEEIIPSFGWVKKPQPKSMTPVPAPISAPARPLADEPTQTLDMDMDMTTAMGGILQAQTGKKPAAQSKAPNGDEQTELDMTMDVTQVVGGILERQMKEPLASDNHDYSQNEATMEFTTALGSIKGRPSTAATDLGDNEHDDDLSMELTTVIGSVLSRDAQSAAEALQQQKQQKQQAMANAASNESNATMSVDMDMDMDMEMTTAMGGILDQAADDNDDENGATVTLGMDITAAVGRILGAPTSESADAAAGGAEEDETLGMEMTSVLGDILPKGQPAPASTSTAISASATVDTLTAPTATTTTTATDVATADEPLVDLETPTLPPPKPVEASSPFKELQSPAHELSSSPFKSPAKSPAKPKAAPAAAPTLTQPADLQPRAAHATSRSRSKSPEKTLAPAEAPATMRVTRTRSKSKSPEKADAAPLPPPARHTRSRARSQSPSKPATKLPVAASRKSMPVSAILSRPPSDSLRTPATETPEITATSPGLSTLQQPTQSLKHSLAADATSPAGPTTPINLETPPQLKDRHRSKSPNASPSVARVSRQTGLKTGQNKETDDKSPNRATSGASQQDALGGSIAPPEVLTPKPRRLSGVGADRKGLGSPKVSELLDTRPSLDQVAAFTPATTAPRTVAFESPKVMEEEVMQEEARENARLMAQKKLDGGEATLNLREMIQSLSPKKRAMAGRKSLHVGSARGLLGKRPVELDSDDDEESRDGVKRLKGLPASPVKNVRLQQPPSKEETAAGRVSRATPTRQLLSEPNTPSKATATPKAAAAATPKGRRNLAKLTSFLGSNTNEATRTGQFDFDELPALQPNDADGNRIYLHDFLNMTSIRFMELNTTKRRHTMAPTRMDGSALDLESDLTLERCVVAGACTVPMLELYQHSCRELKKYISEGRRIVREIETETFEENPPLFREYMSATPEFKALMDNQFKNVKTHARLLSKAMWYEWRMKLQDGIKEGLVRISEGMDEDQAVVEKQEALVAAVLPAAVAKKELLTKERDNLAVFATEIAACDPAELRAARNELADVTQRIDVRRREMEELQRQLDQTEAEIADATQQRAECQAAITAAEKVREECRGWSAAEVGALQERVTALQSKHGWKLVSISGTVLSLTYRDDVRVSFDAAAFRRGQRNRPISVAYVGGERALRPQPATPEREFFVQCMRDYVACLTQSRTQMGLMLRVVAATWEKARAVVADVRVCNTVFPTRVVRSDDDDAAAPRGLDVVWSLLICQLETRIEVALRLQAQVSAAGVDVVLVPAARVVYGEAFNTGKMLDFWRAKAGECVYERAERRREEDKAPWCDVLVDLQARLLARGRKGRKTDR